MQANILQSPGQSLWQRSIPLNVSSAETEKPCLVLMSCIIANESLSLIMRATMMTAPVTEHRSQAPGSVLPVRHSGFTFPQSYDGASISTHRRGQDRPKRVKTSAPDHTTSKSYSFGSSLCHWTLGPSLSIPHSWASPWTSPRLQMRTETGYNLLIKIPSHMPTALAFQPWDTTSVETVWPWPAQQKKTKVKKLISATGIGGKTMIFVPHIYLWTRCSYF